MEKTGQALDAIGGTMGTAGVAVPEGVMEIVLFGVIASAIFLFATYIGVKIGAYFISQKAKKKKFLKTVKIEEEKGNSVQILSFDKNGNPKLLLIEEKKGKNKEYRYI